MTMFPKPNVGIAFNPGEEVAEEHVREALTDQWATTTARKWALAILLVILCVVTFIYPTFSAAFLPGDDSTVRSNPVLYNIDGLKTIWGAPQRLPQLSPVSYSILLIERQFFTIRPRGYHVISIADRKC